MSTQIRKGQTVAVFVSDPWEFGTQCGVGPFLATVEDVRTDLLILHLEEPIEYGGPVFSIVAKPRHAASVDRAFVATNEMTANLLLLRAEVRDAGELDQSVLKRGVPAIGSVRISP